MVPEGSLSKRLVHPCGLFPQGSQLKKPSWTFEGVMRRWSQRPFGQMAPMAVSVVLTLSEAGLSVFGVTNEMV